MRYAATKTSGKNALSRFATLKNIYGKRHSRFEVFPQCFKRRTKETLLKRINTPEKNWKFSRTDAKERAFWDDYMQAYQEAIEATSTKNAPWYIVPADSKWFTRVAVSEVIAQKLESLDMKYPVLNEEHRKELLEAKKDFGERELIIKN
jgi:hypothetical protein